MEQICPNITTCNLVVRDDLGISKIQKEEYLTNFCNDGDKSWSSCTRYLTKKAINFCPDFVLPTTKITPNEVIDKFDEENI